MKERQPVLALDVCKAMHHVYIKIKYIKYTCHANTTDLRITL